jgi:flavin-dependent dehydrogenase
METGEIAAAVIDDALSSGDLAHLREYPAHIERELRPKYVGYVMAERWLSRGWVIDFMARRVNRSSYLRDAVVKIITDEADPREVFSVRGILKSVWG